MSHAAKKSKRVRQEGQAIGSEHASLAVHAPVLLEPLQPKRNRQRKQSHVDGNKQQKILKSSVGKTYRPAHVLSSFPAACEDTHTHTHTHTHYACMHANPCVRGFAVRAPNDGMNSGLSFQPTCPSIPLGRRLLSISDYLAD